MKCPKCGHEMMKRRKRCEICGQDLSMYERLQRISNSFYNKGLERAKVRDLTGAIEMLKKSLEMNKENTDARNLLGLVYFEMGEVVAALSEWVISKHFNPNDNIADKLIEKVQADTVAFDAMNQTIKKYNIALANAKRQDDDLAILQLKRAISMHPKYVRALLLLSLIYLKNCEYEKARRCLVRVQKIDVGNVQAMRYMEEIRLQTQGGTQNTEQQRESDDFSSTPQFVPVHSYREEKPNFIAFLTFFLGVIIGVAVIYYMAVPNIRRNIMEDYNREEKNYSSMLSAKDVSISSLESQIRILENEINDLERTLRREEGYVLTDFEPLVDALYHYHEYLQLEVPTMEQADALMKEIYALDMSEMEAENDNAAVLYEVMKEDMEERTGAFYSLKGLQLYAEGKYEEALPVLEQAYTYVKLDPEVLYHLGRIYHSMGDLPQAKLLYQILISECQDSVRCQEAEVYLGYIKEQEAMLALTPTVTPTPVPAE